MRDERRTTKKQTLKIELLSQWKLEAEFRNFIMGDSSLPLQTTFLNSISMSTKTLFQVCVHWSSFVKYIKWQFRAIECLIICSNNPNIE